MKNNLNLVYAALLIGMLWSCEGDKKPAETSEIPVTEKQVNVPVFNADSAFDYVKRQVEFGPRVPNTAAHKKCGDFLESKLKATGAEVMIQSFTAKAYDGTTLELENIIASVNPAASKRILLAAHWDSRPFADQDEKDKRKPIDGANDGGSGVGVLLEVVRTLQLASKKPDVGVDIILFDGEDYGQPDFDSDKGEAQNSWCLGSQYWSKNRHKENYSAYYGILLDMVGAKNAKFAKEGTSMHFAPSVVEKVWNIAHMKGFGNYFISQETGAITDDHAYVNELAKIPMIDIIEYNVGGKNYFGDYWHTHDDNMEVIDRATLNAVGQTLLEVIYRE
jgi:glutaminyl-peptide cyclotransferase